MKRHLIRYGLCLFIIVLMVSAVVIYQENRPYTWLPPESVSGRDTIRVAADMGFSPISFYDENNNPAGHDVEMIYKIGEYLGVNMEVSLVTWSSALNDFRNGDYDLLLGVSNLPDREEWIALSKPYLNEPCVLFGEKEERFNITDFSGSRLAYLSSDGSVDEVIQYYDLIPVAFSTYQQCFEAMAAGTCDYAIAPASVGKNILKAMGSHSFEIKDIAIHNNIFSIGVQPGNADLLNQINEALTLLNTSGVMNEIYGRWMVTYVGDADFVNLIAENPMVYIMSAATITFAYFAACLILQNKHVKNLHQQERETSRMLSLKNDLLLESVRNIQRATEMLAIARHDWNKHLSVLTEYYRKEPEKAAEYLNALRNEIQQIPLIFHTENALVNTILNVHSGKALEKSIAFHTNIILPQSLPIPDKDLCAVLMNLLDNAIEAADKSEGNRLVSVQMYTEDEDLRMVIENSLAKDFDIAEFRKAMSVKAVPGKDEHGFGIASVNAILKGYCGELLYAAEDGKMVLRTSMTLANH